MKFTPLWGRTIIEMTGMLPPTSIRLQRTKMMSRPRQNEPSCLQGRNRGALQSPATLKMKKRWHCDYYGRSEPSCQPVVGLPLDVIP